jgi:hypothetical protein
MTGIPFTVVIKGTVSPDEIGLKMERFERPNVDEDQDAGL